MDGGNLEGHRAVNQGATNIFDYPITANVSIQLLSTRNSGKISLMKKKNVAKPFFHSVTLMKKKL